MLPGFTISSKKFCLDDFIDQETCFSTREEFIPPSCRQIECFGYGGSFFGIDDLNDFSLVPSLTRYFNQGKYFCISLHRGPHVVYWLTKEADGKILLLEINTQELLTLKIVFRRFNSPEEFLSLDVNLQEILKEKTKELAISPSAENKSGESSAAFITSPPPPTRFSFELPKGGNA